MVQPVTPVKRLQRKGNRRVFELCMQMQERNNRLRLLCNHFYFYVYLFVFLFSFNQPSGPFQVSQISLSLFLFPFVFLSFAFPLYFFSEMSILRKYSNDQSEVRICENWASPIFHLYRIDQSATSVGTKRLIGASIKVEDRSKMATLFAMAPFLCLSRIVFFSLAFRLFLSR